MRSGGWLFFICVWMLASGARGTAAQPQPLALHFEAVATPDHPMERTIMALARDTVGFLWIGTQDGLFRYDGARVRAFPHGPAAGALPDPFVTTLAEAEDGALWVGTSGGGLSRFDPATERFTAFDALHADAIAALLMDTRGVLWIGTREQGLVRHAGPGASTVYRRAAGGAALVGDSVRALLAPAVMPGTRWVGTTSGLSIFDTARQTFRPLRHVPGDPASLSDPHVTALAEAGGAVWVGTADGVLHRYDPATGRLERFGYRPAGAPAVEISVLAASRARDGLLWIGTRGQGVYAFDAAARRPVPLAAAAGAAADSTLLGRADVLSLIEDAAGLLWIGTFGRLYKADVSGPRFRPYRRDPAAATTLGPGAVLSLYEAPTRPGIVWIGTQRGGLSRLDRRTGRYDHFFTRPGHPLNLVFALHEDAAGRFWLGTTGRALYRMDRADGTVEAFPFAEAERVVVMQLYAAPSRPGVLWLATHGAGLVAFDVARGTVLERYTTAGPPARRLGSDDVWAVLEHPEMPGTLWIATHGGGLQRLDLRTRRITPVPASDDTGCRLSDRVVALAAQPGGDLWVGTFADGLYRLTPATGTCRHYTAREGLALPDVGALFRDADRRLWIGSNDGLAVFDPEAEVFTHFTAADGLQSNTIYYTARHRNAAGELMFGGPGGFNIIDPAEVALDTIPPPVVFTRVRVDGQPYRPGPDGQLPALRYDQNDLAFAFAALDLRRPAENRYRVWLEGADEAWREIGGQADERFPSLAPGRYTFHVRGAGPSGYWSRPGATLSFVIRPPFWKAWWFWSLLTAGVVGLIASAYQYRIRQILQVEQTRQRIADDLHDDIGSKISNVALRLELSGRNPALAEADRRQFAELAQTTRSVVDDLRDAVWIVDAEYDHLAALVARMELFAGQMLRGRRYTFQRPDALPPVPLGMEVRRHVYLFFKEALHNVVRHAGAGYVAVRVDYAAGRLTLAVRDDGSGFDPDTRAQGRGLKTLRRRAEHIGGRCELETAPGRGTTVRLVVEIA